MSTVVTDYTVIIKLLVVVVVIASTAIDLYLCSSSYHPTLSQLSKATPA